MGTCVWFGCNAVIWIQICFMKYVLCIYYEQDSFD